MKQRHKIYIGILLMGSLSGSLFGACADELNMGGKKITNVASPENPNDAATRAYVDRGGETLSESTVTHNGVTYGVLYAGGKAWLDRNLGATKQAESSTDAGAYGDLYQWGRAADGHEKRNSGTTNTLATSDTVGDGANEPFIIPVSEPHNWRSINRTHFWTSLGDAANGVCPAGWRVPTPQDFMDLNIVDSNDAYQKLRLPLGGLRHNNPTGLDKLGTDGYLWTSMVDDEWSRYFRVNAEGSYLYSAGRSYGFSVRCVKYLN